MSGRIWNFFFSITMMLLGKEISPTVNKGMDEFMTAVFEGDVTEVNRFLNSGHDANTCDSYKRTALQLAVEGRNVKIVRMLLTFGAQVNTKGFGGYTALHLAVSNTLDNIVQCGSGPSGEDMGILIFLLEAGADIYITDKEGETPIGISESYRNTEISNLLKSYV